MIGIRTQPAPARSAADATAAPSPPAKRQRVPGGLIIPAPTIISGTPVVHQDTDVRALLIAGGVIDAVIGASFLVWRRRRRRLEAGQPQG